MPMICMVGDSSIHLQLQMLPCIQFSSLEVASIHWSTATVSAETNSILVLFDFKVPKLKRELKREA